MQAIYSLQSTASDTPQKAPSDLPPSGQLGFFRLGSTRSRGTQHPLRPVSPLPRSSSLLTPALLTPPLAKLSSRYYSSVPHYDYEFEMDHKSPITSTHSGEPGHTPLLALSTPNTPAYFGNGAPQYQPPPTQERPKQWVRCDVLSIRRRPLVDKISNLLRFPSSSAAGSYGPSSA